MSWQFFLMSCIKVAVLVPRFVVELHEPHAAFDQPAGQQAVVANDGLPGSAPYISRMCFGSFEISISSGALACIR